MAEAKIYIDDRLDARWREISMRRFGYGRGSISKAAEEAITRWVSEISSIEGRISKIVETAESDSNVMAVILFGSYNQGRPDFRDVDIAILAAGSPDGQKVLRRYTDMGIGQHTPIDLQVLNSLPIDIRSRVLEEGKIIYCRDRGALYDYSIRVMQEWNEAKPIFALISSR